MFRSLGLLGRFSLYSFVGMVLVGLFSGWYMSERIEQQIMKVESEEAVRIVNSVVSHRLKPADFKKSMKGDRYDGFDKFISRVVDDENVVRVKIWNHEGVVVYSDAQDLVGKKFEMGHDLQEALEGEVEIEIEDLDEAENTAERGAHASLLEIYAPIRLAGSNEIVGAYEVYRTLAPITREIRLVQVATFVSLGAGLAVLYVLLFWIVRGASRTIVRQKREVEGTNRELDRVNKHLEKANKLKSEFLANMSHELRTPLNSIMGFSEVLQDELFGELNEKQGKYVGNIHQSGKHLLRLINDILDLSKVEAGKMELRLEEFALGEAISNVESTIRSLAREKNIVLETNVRQDRPLVADSAKFKQIMYNLLSNAVKFTPKGGKVTVDIDGTDTETRVSVADTGIGICEEDQDKIFKEFQQLDSSYSREYEGTGLGLALTRKFVEMHGGKITVSSEEGKGSAFVFAIPRVEKPMPAPQEDDPPVVASPPERAQEPASVLPESSAGALSHIEPDAHPLILVVEDDQQASELLKTYLEDGEFKVAQAFDGAEAVRLARQLEPFAITLDIMLPKKDGWEVLHALKSDPKTRNIPVIVVSMIDEYDMGFALGAAEYLVKPVDKATLLGTLAKYGYITRAKHESFTVLVVDDDPKAVDLVTAIIEPEGMGVFKAYGGEQAIEVAVEKHPDLIILDLMMPRVSGFDVIQRIRAHPTAKDIPILILTAKELTNDDRKHLHGEFERIIQKAQFSKEDLLHEIKILERLEPDRAMMIDRVTGLFNYRYFRRRLYEESKRADRYKRAFSVMFIEFAALEEARDSYGAAVADEIIKEAASALRSNVRAADPLARYGDDSFVLIFPETPKEGADMAAEKIRRLISAHRFTHADKLTGGGVDVQLSHATYFEDARDPDALVMNAIQGLPKKPAKMTATAKPQVDGSDQ
ncbi:MAG: response regulator [Terriglobia bacterium]